MIILYLKITEGFELQPLAVKSISTLSLFKLMATGPNVSSIPNQFWCSENIIQLLEKKICKSHFKNLIKSSFVKHEIVYTYTSRF